MSSKFNIAALLLGFAAGAAHAQVTTIITTPAPVSTQAAAASHSGYDASVQALMHAADALRASIHAMAHEPAGPERNRAIREANRALLDTQVAMANAYDVTAFGGDTRTLGAGSAPVTHGDRTVVVDPNGIQCTRLGAMVGCQL